MHRHAIFGGRWKPTLAMLLLAGGVSACSSVTDSLLEAPDPDLIDPKSVQSAAGATALYNGTIRRLQDMTGGGGSAQSAVESSWMFGGLLADEWASTSTFVQNDETDQRAIQENNSSIAGQLRNIYRTRTSAIQAIAALKQFLPAQPAQIAEMYFIRGFAELQLASDFCNGIPLSDGTGAVPVDGEPRTIAQVYTVAIASFDSALALAPSTTDRINRAARIGKARALVGLGANNLDQAAALVAGIPTSFAYQATYSLSSGGSNQIWAQGISSRRYSVGDSLEGNGRNLLVKNAIPFWSLKDPRVPVTATRPTGQDGQTATRSTTIWGQLSPVDVVNGIDARLIEAEAALRKGDPSWLTILNALRAAPQKLSDVVTTPVMAPLADPGDAASRLDLLFREKALWTFGRGQRLADLRRLIRQYGRTAANTFPQGLHYKGGSYGGDVNLPIVTDERTNLKFTGCIDRNA